MISILIATLAANPGLVHPTPPPIPPSSATLGGAAVPGLCFLSQPAVLEHSKIGMAATARLQQLAEQVQKEIEAGRVPIETARKAYQADASKLTPAQSEQRQQTIAEMVKGLQHTAQLRSREIEATRRKAQARIATEMQPAIQQAYQARSCGVLVDRGSVLGGNMTNDLTPAVVQGLDARISTISFDRELLPDNAPEAQ